MSETEWTIGRLLDWTKDYLANAGSDSPRLDAEVLLAHARNCQRIELYTAFDDVAGDDLRAAFRDLVKRRAEGTPVAYLVGMREFYSLQFEVNSSVLIPRPETEFLVIRMLDLARESGKANFHVVDIGTGSGILAICAALYLKESTVVAIDISPDALEVARRNAVAHGVADRIDFREGDLLAGLEPEERFDFVISNPPYVSDSEYRELDPQVRDHEPGIALVAGPTGTELIDRIAAQAPSHLNEAGWLLVEVSPMIASSVERLLGDGAYQSIHTTNDLARHPRIISAQLR